MKYELEKFFIRWRKKTNYLILCQERTLNIFYIKNMLYSWFKIINLFFIRKCLYKKVKDVREKNYHPSVSEDL